MPRPVSALPALEVVQRVSAELNCTTVKPCDWSTSAVASESSEASAMPRAARWFGHPVGLALVDERALDDR
jgi:hypothetical protein